MHLAVFLSFAAVLIGTVAAENDRSYLHALQTVFFYFLYKWELLLDLNDRIIGVRCRDWDKDAEKCRVVQGKETYERCPGSRTVSTPTGRSEKGVCTLREFIVHVTGRGGDRAEADLKSLDKFAGLDWRSSAETMHKHGFGDGMLRPWAVIKDGGNGYISAIRRGCGQIAKARKVWLAVEGPDVQKRINDGIGSLEGMMDTIKKERVIEKDRLLLDDLEGSQKSKWGGFSPVFDADLQRFDYDKTLARLRTGNPTEKVYELRKKNLDAAIANFNKQKRTVTHNAAAKGWDDSKVLLVKDC